MKLSEFKTTLRNIAYLNFQLPDGTYIPEHFHITEIGKLEKNFIDCGGTFRNEMLISLQLWTADDYDHHLAIQKLMDIISLSEEKLNLGNHEIEIEYQGDTIGRYGLKFEAGNFILQPKLTNCLAPDKCGISTVKPKIRMSSLSTSKRTACCELGSGCC
ncbi:MAG: DUF6428 family protein [Bacteroidota bacterium]